MQKLSVESLHDIQGTVKAYGPHVNPMCNSPPCPIGSALGVLEKSF